MEYIITGTQAYGPASKDSDLDIVIHQKDAKEFKIWLNDRRIEWENNINADLYANPCFYFNLFGITMNIIIADDDLDFECWKQATAEMGKIDPIANRDKRLLAFQTFYHLYKGGCYDIR